MVTINRKSHKTSSNVGEGGFASAAKTGKKNRAKTEPTPKSTAGRTAAHRASETSPALPKPNDQGARGGGNVVQSLLPNPQDHLKEIPGTQKRFPLQEYKGSPQATAATLSAVLAKTPKLRQVLGNQTIGQAVNFWSAKLTHDQGALTWAKSLASKGATSNGSPNVAYYEKLTQTDQGSLTLAKSASQAAAAATRTIGQADNAQSSKLIHDQGALIWAESQANNVAQRKGSADLASYQKSEQAVQGTRSAVAYYQKLVQSDQGALALTKQAKAAALQAWGTDNVVLDDKQHPVELKNGVTTPVGSGELYFNGTPRASDVRQGSIGDCYMVASLASLANSSPQTIKNNIRSTGQPGVYEVKLFRPDPNGSSAMVPVVETVNAKDVHVRPVSDPLTKKQVIWPALYEQAFAQLREQNHKDLGGFAEIGGGGLARSALPILTGKPVTATFSTVPGVTTPFFLARALAAGKPVAVGFPKADAAAGTFGPHEYSILNISPDLKSITLRNPWGVWGSKPTNSAVTVHPDGSATMPIEIFNALPKDEVVIGDHTFSKQMVGGEGFEPPASGV
jgi:hypothetical protein